VRPDRNDLGRNRWPGGRPAPAPRTTKARARPGGPSRP